jgi:enoyl-CoA hydratase
MAEPAVIVEKDGHVLTVTLNRPEKRNAVNCEVMCRLYDAWTQLDEEGPESSNGTFPSRS